jgi:Ca2+-binding EF-hand superfamily protein
MNGRSPVRGGRRLCEVRSRAFGDGIRSLFMQPRRVSKSLVWVLPGLVGVAAAGAFAEDQEAKKPAQPAALFADLDRNHDGVVESSEIAPDTRKAFEKLVQHGDADHDGKLSEQEYSTLLKRLGEPAKKAAGQVAGPLAQRIKAMDANGDGRISRDEFKGRPAAFDRLDVNHDGFIDRADRIAAQAKKSADAAKEKKPTTE